MAKTFEDLKKSQSIRQEILRKYGSVPTSIWKMSFAENKLVWDPRTRQAEVSFKNESMPNFMQKSFSSSGKTVRGKGKGQSTLPYDMAKRIVMFYSEKGNTVLNPTMGDPTSMTVVNQLNRNFIGYDISEENFNINLELKEKLMGNKGQQIISENKCFIDIYKKSSENMSEITNNSVDMVFFSPPYWDTEFYGEEKEQLGFGKTYPDFLNGLGCIINETYRILKPGKYCCININDFRKNGQFYDFHIDTANLMSKAGYKRYDTIIIMWANCIGQCFASQVEERKATAKQHEYLIVGKKE